LKTVEDALDIRRRILLAFEAAEREPDPDRRRTWMTFVIVGGGPTGVELAGAIGELSRGTLKDDFRHIDPAQAQILLLEGAERVLPVYPPDLSAKAEASLARLGVTVRTQCLVTDIQDEVVTVSRGDQVELIQARTVLWAAGMQASPMGRVLAERTGVELDRAGRVMVEPDLSVAHHPDIFVIGDLAHFAHQDGSPLPGVAPVAMQQGQYVADLIQERLSRSALISREDAASEQDVGSSVFEYRVKGSLAVIGRNVAVAELGALKFSGFLAWWIWLFVHIGYLIEFDNKLLVLFQWAWNYFTRKRGARLITGDDPFPLVEATSRDQLHSVAAMPFEVSAEVEG
jgi:NADH dehydrogenase